VISVRWASPEVLTRQQFSKASDAWAFGVVMWEIFSRCTHPYGAMTPTQVVEYVTAGKTLEHPVASSDAVWKLMLRCWSAKPELRPSFLELHHTLEEITVSDAVVQVPDISLHVNDAIAGIVSSSPSHRLAFISGWRPARALNLLSRLASAI